MKKNLRNLILLVLLIISGIASGQNVRGFYLTGIHTWLGNPVKENVILNYAKGNNFNYFALYDLNSINWSNPGEKNKLAHFISRARAQFGITQFGAVVETYSFALNNIIAYNNSRIPAERFDVINQEFEFWILSSIANSYCNQYLTPGGYTCDTAGAWDFGWKEFQKIDSLCATRGLTSEVYLGWPTRGQMQSLASIADRILLHAYRPNDSDLYAYSKNRLMDIASVNAIKKVIPIFSTETAYMESFMDSTPVNQPYRAYANDLAAETDPYKNKIDLQGYQWFHYDLMPQNILSTASISSNGPLNFCPGGSVTLTASPGASYLSVPGGQTTASITVSNPGLYKVKVTASNGHSVFSAPVIVAHSTIAQQPMVTASGPASFCPGGSVTLTSTQSANYNWSNGSTFQSIVVSTSGNYYVTTGTATCQATSVPVHVNAAAVPAVPTISTSGTTDICNGNTVILTSSSASGYLWSNGATTRSIAVTSAGNYKVNAYAGTNCSAQSSIKTVNVLPTPPTPVISANSSTILNSNHPSVDLTSSYADSYEWSNTATTRSITVSSQGTYRVIVAGPNGCTATSNQIAVKANGCIPPAAPTIVVSGSNNIAQGQSVTLTSSSSGGYLWSTGETTNSITVSTSGTYTVRAYNGGYCYSTSLPETITVFHARKAKEMTEENVVENVSKEVSTYPNPANGILNLAFSLKADANMFMTLSDITGKIVRQKEIAAHLGENNFTEDVSEIPTGIYIASLISGSEKRMVRIVVQH